MISINPFATSLSRLTSGLTAPALALGLAMGAALPACSSNNPTTDGGGGDGGMTVTDGGTGGDGGVGGDGGMGGDGGSGPLIAGSQYVPVPTLPASAALLPNERFFLSWHAGDLPAGRTFQNYEFCSTLGAASEIDDPSLCPFGMTFPNFTVFLDLPFANSTFRWKVRSLYDGGHYSDWSAVQVFSTDISLNAWLRLDGNVNDGSGLGHNGTAHGGVGFIAGVDQQALSCDGVDDYVDLGGGLALAGPLTVSAWIYGNGTPTSANSGILNQGALNYALTYHTDGRVYFYINNSGNSVSAPVSPGAWHHILGIFNGTTAAGGMRLYVDGILADQKASSFATTGATGNLEIGRNLTSYFNGRIDNVTIYNVALSDAAILNEYCVTPASGGGTLPAACTP